jgi:hypothetical protein
MRRKASNLHLFLTLMLLAGLLFGSFGRTLVNALGNNDGTVLGKNAIPKPVSFKRQNPTTTITNADTLIFQVEFSDTVSGVDVTDFIIHNDPAGTTTAFINTVTRISDRIYNVTIKGGDLDSFNGFVGLDFSSTAVINDATGTNPIPTPEPSIDETYFVDNKNPTVVISLADQPATRPVEFIAVFSEEIITSSFTVSDLSQSGTVPGTQLVWNIVDSGDHQSFSITATTTQNGTIGPILAAGLVTDLAGNGNEIFTDGCSIDSLPLNDNCAVVNDLQNPTVKIEQASGQADPADTQPVNFKITFSEEINPATFEHQDIVMDSPAAAAQVTDWTINPTGDNMTFTLAVWSSTNGFIVPTLPAGGVFDWVGNGNVGFTKNTCDNNPPDNCVYLQDDLRPTVTIEQHTDQLDPANLLPIKFTVEFSEPINKSDFTADDILQTGTAGNIQWEVRATGASGQLFTIFAVEATRGTLVPIIPHDSVRDLVGNFNRTSTSVDNSVTYSPNAPTSTPIQVPFKTVVISEVAWMGTSSLTPSDEWIELYNPTNELVELNGWHLVSYRWTGTTTNGRWDKNLDIAFGVNDRIQPRNSIDPENTSGYFLLERGINETDDDAVKGIKADKIYTSLQLNYSSLSDSGEILLLCSRENIKEGVCNVNEKNKLVDYVNGSLSSTGANNPWPAGKAYPLFGSMERKNLQSDENTAWFTHPANKPRWGHDRNWNGKTLSANIINGTPKHPNWAFEVTATPLPTVTPTRTPTRVPNTTTALLVLNEVLARAGSDWNRDGKVDVYDEYIEVINSGVVNVVLSNYKLDDGLNVGSAPFSLPNQTLKPGEIAVFYGSQTGIRLEDSGDTVRLLRASNSSVLDAVTYPIAKLVDTSVCRYTDAYGSWLTNCFPTPGLPNALTGKLRPPTSGGNLIPVCFLPDSAPDEFVLAECGIESGGIWNHLYWDSFPGEGTEIYQVDPHDKWLVVYQ